MVYQRPTVARGWKDVVEEVVIPRMIVSSQGEHREGKSTFGLTMPGPIACFPFDNNTRELVQRWLSEKRILVPNESLDYTGATKIEEWKPIWNKYESAWEDALNTTWIRSIMLDTATEANELCRLAEFGKLEQVQAHRYGVVNARFKRLIDLAYRSDKNILLIHRQKDEYEKSKKGDGVRTGRRVLAGFGDVPYKVQITLLHWRTDQAYDPETGIGVDEERGLLGFGFNIMTCTQDARLAGKYLAEPDNTWAGLGSVVYPEAPVSTWTATGK